MKNKYPYAVAALSLAVVGCGISRQIQEAKTFGDCRYAVGSADSVYVAGYDVGEFRDINGPKDINPVKSHV